MYRISRLYISLAKIFDSTGKTETGLKLENTISLPDLNIETTFAIFSSLGNMPVTKDWLHICARGLFIQLWINFVMRGRKSSNPAALSLKLHVILYISSSVAVDAKNFSDISHLMYSLGHLLVEGISLAKDSPTFTQKVLNLLAITFPSLITSPLYLNFELTGQYFLLLMIGSHWGQTTSILVLTLAMIAKVWDHQGTGSI